MKLEIVKNYADLIAISIDEVIKMMTEYAIDNDLSKNEIKNIIHDLIEKLDEVTNGWTNKYHHHHKDKNHKE